MYNNKNIWCNNKQQSYIWQIYELKKKNNKLTWKIWHRYIWFFCQCTVVFQKFGLQKYEGFACFPILLKCLFATNNSCRKGLLLIGLKAQKRFSKALNVFITLFVPLMFSCLVISPPPTNKSFLSLVLLYPYSRKPGFWQLP